MVRWLKARWLFAGERAELGREPLRRRTPSGRRTRCVPPVRTACRRRLNPLRRAPASSATYLRTRDEPTPSGLGSQSPESNPTGEVRRRLRSTRRWGRWLPSLQSGGCPESPGRIATELDRRPAMVPQPQADAGQAGRRLVGGADSGGHLHRIGVQPEVTDEFSVLIQM